MASTASATVPVAAVKCDNLQPQLSGSNIIATGSQLGGTSFDNAEGTSPGSNGVYLGSNPGSAESHSAVTLLAVLDKGATSTTLTTKAGSAVAVSDQNFTIAGSATTYKVTSDTTPLGKAFPDIVTFTPAFLPTSPTVTSVKAGTVVTIDPTSGTAGANHLVTATETLGSNVLGGGGFNSGDVGQEVNVAYNPGSGVWGDASGFTARATASSTGGTLTGATAAGTTYSYDIQAVNSSDANLDMSEGVSATIADGVTDGSVALSWTLPSFATGAGWSVDVYGRTILPNNLKLLSDGTGLSPTGSYTDTGAGTVGTQTDTTSLTIVSVSSGDATLSESITGPTASSPNVLATVGSTNVTPSAVYEDENFTLFGGAGGNSNGACYTNLGYSLGSFAPASGTMVGSTTTTRYNAAIGLEQAPAAWAGTITWPSVSSGWLDDGGEAAAASPPTTSFTFSNAKYDLFVLLENAYTFAEGTATGEYKLTALASVGFSATGMVTCTIAQIQAINSNTGPDADPSSAYYISPTEQSETQSQFNNCDGGPNERGRHHPDRCARQPDHARAQPDGQCVRLRRFAAVCHLADLVGPAGLGCLLNLRISSTEAEVPKEGRGKPRPSFTYRGPFRAQVPSPPSRYGRDPGGPMCCQGVGGP